MKKNFKTSKNVVRTICLVVVCILVCVALFGALSVVVKAIEKKTKRIYPGYSIGSLSSNGVYVESDQSIFTKNLIECMGLKTTIQFNNVIRYSIYFYDENENYLANTGMLTGNFAERPELARYCRIVITPKDDDQVKWYEILKYSKQVKVEVNKVQKWNNLFNVETIDYKFNDDSDDLTHKISASGWSKSGIIDISGYNTLRIYTKATSGDIYVYVADNKNHVTSKYGITESGNIKAMSVDDSSYAGYSVYEIDLLSTNCNVGISIKTNNEIFVFGR